jgi:tetratricopeptide (TPR) repeat protein
LAPVLGAVKFGTQLVADRYSYLPCMAWSVLAAAALLELARRRPGSGGALVPAGLVLVAILWALTWHQLSFWQDSETLYRRVLDVDPGQALAHNNLGLVLETAGRSEQAEEQFRLALTLRPHFAAPHNNLGTIMLKSGRLEEASAQFHAALDSDPTNLEAYNNLGLILAHDKRYDEAISMFDSALSLDPGFRLAAQNRALCLREKQAARR